MLLFGAYSKVSDPGGCIYGGGRSKLTCYIYSSRVPHNSLFESRGVIVPPVDIKGRFLVVWSQKTVSYGRFPIFRAKM